MKIHAQYSTHLIAVYPCTLALYPNELFAGGRSGRLFDKHISPMRICGNITGVTRPTDQEEP